MNAIPPDFAKALSAEGIFGQTREVYLREAEQSGDRQWVDAIIEGKLPGQAKVPTQLCDASQPPAVLQFNDNNQPEYVLSSDDPRNQIYNHLDGPELLDRKTAFVGWSEELADLLDFICCEDREGKVPPHDCGVRAIAVRKLIRAESTASSIKDRHGVSRQSISQAIGLFRNRFGDVVTLRTRSPEQRKRMEDAQLNGANHWRKKRQKDPDKLSPVRGDSKAETQGAYAPRANVNCATGNGVSK